MYRGICCALCNRSYIWSMRKFTLLGLYGLSIILSAALFLMSGIYCQIIKCNLSLVEKGRQHAQELANLYWGRAPAVVTSKQQGFEFDLANDQTGLFPLIVSCIILVFSLAWLLSHLSYIDTECFQEYTCLEMPTAVFSSLLAGVCAVIEIHYSFDYSYVYYWSERWTFTAVKIGASTALVFLHATIAFTLT